MNVSAVASRLGAAIAATLPTLAFGAATVVDLSAWTAVSYPAVQGFPSGVWVVEPGGGSVTQMVNGQPTLLYSDFSAYGTKVSGKIRPSAIDDDYIGFVIGYQPGDVGNTAASYLLIDWKQVDQTYNFPAPSSSGGGLGRAGLAVSQVSGIPDADEFWQHANLAGTPAGSGLQELARASTLGSTGWVAGQEYEFSFDFGPNNLRVFVDGVKQIDIGGNFSDGRIGFYNFSQEAVTYSAFEVDDGSFPVPLPSTLALLLGGALAGAAVRRRAG